MNASDSLVRRYRYRKFQRFTYLGGQVHIVSFTSEGLTGPAACGARPPWFIWPGEVVSGPVEVGPQCEECWVKVYFARPKGNTQ